MMLVPGSAQAESPVPLVGEAATIVADRSYFLRDDRPGCPARTRACRQRAFLVRGDAVVVDESDNGFIMVNYVDRAGRWTNGWMPEDAVHAAPFTPQPGDWLGFWQRADASLHIRAGTDPDRLIVNGAAFWRHHNPARPNDAVIHDGALEDAGFTLVGADTAMLGRPDTRFGAYDCQVQLRHIGTYLMVSDNGYCGGLNASFTGIYRRTGG